MISGSDIVVPTKLSAQRAFRAALKQVRKHWPDAVVQNEAAGEGTAPEVFIYRDGKSLRQWDEMGSSPSNPNTMIHLLWRRHELTIVIDDPETTQMQSLISEITTGVAQRPTPKPQHLSRMRQRSQMAQWIEQALQELGGSGTIVEVNRIIWKQHRNEIETAVDLFFKWQYEVREAADLLKRQGKLVLSQPRGTWRLAG